MKQSGQGSLIQKWWERRKAKKEAAKAKKPKTFKEKVIENVKVFFSAYLIAFFIRLFLIEGYQIPSQSMVPSLMVRDILMVEKLSMGSIFPLTRWKFPGLGRPRANDIIVFVSPDWESPGLGREFISLITLSLVNLDNTFYNPKNLVKRLVGVPGDRISMTNQKLIINGEPVQTRLLKNVSQVIYNQGSRMGYGQYDLYQESRGKYQRIVQHVQGADELIWRDSAVYQARDFLDVFEERYRDIAILEFPEITVPKRGEKIDLVRANPYYKYLLIKLIERESRRKVSADKEGNILLDGQVITEWTPRDDYYFAMGDNRDNSQDCRYFGFIPRRNIFGRILFRYFPFNRFGFIIDENDRTVVNKSFN